ncbi:MAG: hypothetical protein EBV23_03780 [Flavobacteriia bacterium]|nr:hypothetical protein [Flavobacteriia bacterium]
MSDTNVRIRPVLNGWILEIKVDKDQTDRYVFSHDDASGEEQEVKAFAGLLRTLNNLVGPSTSRYSEHRIYVDVQPGDKYSVISQSEE